VSRWLTISAGLHAVAALLVVALGMVESGPRPMPPVYQVALVSAAEIAPMRTRPQPRPPEPEPEEETPPEPEAEEKVPDPEERPTPERERPRDPTPTPREGPERARESGELPVTVEGRPFQFPWYLEQVYRKVTRNWRPTSNTLEATVHFRIAANGRVSDVDVHESSGNFLFDQAARRAVEAAGPMPPLPEGYSGDWLGVYFVFDTRMRPE